MDIVYICRTMEIGAMRRDHLKFKRRNYHLIFVDVCVKVFASKHKSKGLD